MKMIAMSEVRSREARNPFAGISCRPIRTESYKGGLSVHDPFLAETFLPHDRQRDCAQRRALDLLSQFSPDRVTFLSEDEVLEMVDQEIADYRAGR
uniref:Uncharacterized protein n=1 Tax=Candidatus Kentrum sp. LPFa TaxID=2126335 RepID=A0A450WZR8_9GAMM|nr:MAG: hypothetical protein BECKLPF1236A_GA0070988_103491 [Candidatus Kentron sp. LPFa]VFK35538.1 MAG: hypothetical protein BECKLPF1236C_GA0070990_103881 [Candidatus Kentron sp. LPFa]